MSKCIKTGARIFIEETSCVISCDLHLEIIDEVKVIIVRYNPNSVKFGSEFHAKIRIGRRYLNDLGFIVCGLSDFDRDIREFCFF